MTSYAGRHASFYDLFYADKPYADEAAFVSRALARNGAPAAARILDVACGTGRHAHALAALGHDVVGVDHSAEMLAVARARARSDARSDARTPARLEFHQQDMRSLDVGGRPFDACTCLFDSLGYVLTDDAVTEALRSMRAHVRDGGVLVAEVWHAPAMLREHSPVRVRRFRVDDADIVRISETTLDAAAQTAQVRYEIVELRDDGAWARIVESQRNRFFHVDDVTRMFREAGFAPVEITNGFVEGRAVDDGTWHVVIVARAVAATRAETR